jgi:hypothetical protein
MQRTLAVLASLMFVGVAVLPAVQAPRSWTVTDAPSDYQDAAARAMRAFDALQATLSARLIEEMKAGGPTRAVTVCRDEALPLTREIAEQQGGITLGRTSHLVRNPANAPRDWVTPFVERAAGHKAAEFQPVVVDLGSRIGVLRPIGTVAVCTTCHGEKQKQPEALRRLLAGHYPRDAATGFVEGDLRGFFWAELAR